MMLPVRAYTNVTKDDWVIADTEGQMTEERTVVDEQDPVPADEAAPEPGPEDEPEDDAEDGAEAGGEA